MYGIIIDGIVDKEEVFKGIVKFNSLLNKGIEPITQEIECATIAESKVIFGKTFYRCGEHWLHLWK